MKKLIFFFTLILFACSDSYTIEGKIIRVIDGDTFVFQGSGKKFKVRMSDIDAPEISQTFGLRSKDFLQRYLNRRIKLFCKGKDKYKRVLATVFCDSVNINELEIKLGYAWYTVKFSSNEHYFDLQEAAKSLKLGLWQYEHVEPWIYRLKHKKL